MTGQDLLQDQLKQLEEKRHNLIFEIGFLETRKSGMLADYWEVGRQIALVREQFDKYGKGDYTGVYKCVNADTGR